MRALNGRPPVLFWDSGEIMPNSVAKLTGVLVTAIVTFGTDLELTYAIILGVFAGALATFFASLAEAKNLYIED
jgi:hypothetical protein